MNLCQFLGFRPFSCEPVYGHVFDSFFLQKFEKTYINFRFLSEIVFFTCVDNFDLFKKVTDYYQKI